MDSALTQSTWWGGNIYSGHIHQLRNGGEDVSPQYIVSQSRFELQPLCSGGYVFHEDECAGACIHVGIVTGIKMYIPDHVCNSMIADWWGEA